MTRSILAKLLIFSLIVLTLGSLAYTQDLAQRNSEKIFLTDESIASYESFEEEYSQKSLIIVQTPREANKTKAVAEEYKRICLLEDCQVIGPKDLPNSSSPIIKLESDHHSLQILLAPMGEQEVVKEAIKSLKNHFPQAQFAGTAYTNYLLDQYSETIKTTIFPALFICVFILLFISLKSFKEAIICFFAPLMASGLSLLVTKVLFGNSTLVTSIVPLLLFIINLSLILHIHHTAKALRSMNLALKAKKVPIFLMAFTTFIGFGSLYFSKLEAISQFGLLSSSLFLITTLFCVLWPCSLGILFPQIWAKEVVIESDKSKSTLFKFSMPWSLKKVILFSLATCVLGLLSFSKIPIITDATEYFPKKEQIKEMMVQMANELTGTPIVEVILEFKSSDEGPSYNELEELLKIENQIRSQTSLKMISSNQLAVMANEAYAKKIELPPNLLSYYTLLSKSPGTLAAGYGHDSGYRMTLLGGPTNIEEYEDLLKDLTKQLEASGYSPKFNGIYYHLMVAQKEMIITLFKSFTISLVIIALCAFIYFRKIKLFFIFLGVNIIPVLGSFPLLYFIGNSFNVATVMTYSISLGLIVDSSFHIIHALNEEEGSRNHYFYKTIIIPIVQSSLLLTLCFSFFALSDFLPIREFGLSLAVVIFLGMILDLKVLPSLYQKD